MATSVVNAAIGAFTGKDIGERVYAAVFGEPKTSETKSLALAPQAGASSGTRLALSLGPIAQSAPSGVGALIYRQSQATDRAAADPYETATDRKRPSGSSAVVPSQVTLFRGKITRDVIDALDLYDRLAPVRAPQRKKADSEREEDGALGLGRSTREGFTE
jgi:hypothetical protein